jgi:nicotinate-nucleotide adenylyltransferase
MRSGAPSSPRRIGLLGGSFDPVHQAHVALASIALEHLALDELRWIPVGHAWQKSRAMVPAEHRVAMVRLATRHEPRFVVDTIEVDRPGPSYMLDTVRELQAAKIADWFLVIGQDQYANLPSWHGWPELLQRVTLAVARRGDDLPAAPPALRTVPHRLVTLPLPALAVSSTRIREHLAQGQTPTTLVPAMVSDAVAGYIAHHQLYAPGAIH